MVVLDGRSIDDVLSAFAYHPSHRSPLADNHNKPSSPPPLPTTPAPPPLDASSRTRSARGQGRGRGRGRGRGISNRGGNTNRCVEDFESKHQQEEGEENPNAPPPLSQTLRRKSNLRRKILASPSSTSSSPIGSSSSSFIRTKVGGKPVVVSRFFPLPPQASSDVLTDSIRKPKARYSRSRCRDDEKVTKKRKRNCVDEDLNDDGEVLKKRKARKQPTPQLSSAEKKSDAYRRVPTNSTWEPPTSCHHLLQERHAFDPWRVLVICMLLNITTGKQVRKVLPGLFLLCPDAETTTMVPEEEIQKVIQSLGLQKKRARMIKLFSCEYLRNDWTHVTQLHGIGKYAADAYAIFCVGKPNQVVPQDHKLLDYWKFVLQAMG